jgi:TPP-dependent pyruvate/acetoin dehydrogenase alpha subunit
MVRIRVFEEEAGKLMEAGKIPGALHLYVGQEAVAAGVMVHLTSDDQITSTHRGHGHLIAKGGEFDRMFAELYGRATGYCKGKGGSMHDIARAFDIDGAMLCVAAAQRGRDMKDDATALYCLTHRFAVGHIAF